MKKIFILICFAVCLVGSVSASNMVDSDVKDMFDKIPLTSDGKTYINSLDFSAYDYYYQFPYDEEINSFEIVLCNWDACFMNVYYGDDSINSNFYVSSINENTKEFIRIIYRNGLVRILKIEIERPSGDTHYINYNSLLYYYTTYKTVNQLYIDIDFPGVYLYNISDINKFPYCYSNITTAFKLVRPDSANTDVVYSNNTRVGFKYLTYITDSNLKLNIINNDYGEKELAIDFTAFMGGSPANYISVENLVLTVDNDGTEVVFDDLDSYIEHFGIGTEQEVWAYIPLSFLVGSAIDSKLIKVSFTESTSSAGGTFTEDHYISTNFWLKHEEYVTPDIITPPATIYNDVKTSTQINNIINELNQKGSEYDITTGKFSYYQTIPDFPDWADMYEFNVIFSRSGSDASLFDTWHRMNGSNYSPIDWATSSFNVTEFYENSSSWAYADVVVITVYSVIVSLDSSGFVTTGYQFEGFLVWQTDRYYDHQSSFTLIDILDAFQLFANQQVENWNWLSDTFNDIQFNLFDALNEMIRNDDFILDWLKTINVNINKGFDGVVADISNISFPVSGGFSLDDLSDELKSLFIPQKTWADLGYDEYKDSLGVLALPFEFTFDSLDIIKDSSNYSPNFELHVNPLNVDIPDIDGTTKDFEVFQESDITMSPTSLFPASVWNTLQYFNLFTLVVVQALITYNHIFGGEER